MKIAFVCSHGGHLTEMLYLISALEGHDVFFVTYDSPRTKSLGYRKYLFPNFGEKPFEMIKNINKILNIFLKERPQVIISNGAEIAIPFFYISKLLRIKTIFIECYTRVNEPTITGRLIYPVSDIFIVLWPEMLANYGKKARFLGDFFEPAYDKNPYKFQERKNVFVTVGMHYQGFERLVKVMDEIAGKIEDKVIMQIGNTNYKPQNAEYFSFADYEEIKEIMKKSSIIVCQGAMSAIDALVLGTSAVVVPRLKEYGEVINDHQIIFARMLEEKHLVKVIVDITQLETLLVNSKNTRCDNVSIKLNENFVNNLLANI